MKIYDRFTDSYLKDSELPNSIELGRFAIVNESAFTELTSNVFKTKDGQKIVQEILDPVNWVERSMTTQKMSGETTHLFRSKTTQNA